MTIAQNFPAIAPSLLLDFANVQALDSRITFTRATTATYYGTRTAKAEENLVLQSAVPYPSPWAWTNGYIGALGSELVTNGDFSSATGWVGNTGIITGGVAAFVAVAGNIYQNILTVGKRYKLELVVSRFVAAGTFRVRLGGGGTGDLFLNITGTGTYTITGVATVNTTFEMISYTTACNFDIDSVSVKEFVQNFVAAPDTTLTASTLVADAANATYLQTVVVNAADYTFSVYLRRSTGTGDVQIQAGSGTYVTQTITSTWARYTVTQTLAAGSRTAGIRLVTSGDQVEVWGAQVEQRSAVSAYQVTTTQPVTNYIPVLETAASGVARFDHNPTTFESLGLLIEELRTNLVLRSEEFDNAAWSKSNSTITANTIVAPDGTLSVDKLVENTASGAHRVAQAYTTSAVAYTFSVYAKASERSIVQLCTNQTTALSGCNFDVLNGVAGTPSAGITASITPVDNGFYRCSITYTALAVAGSVFVVQQTSISAAMNGAYTGDGYSGIYIWGAQLEVGAFATSYIPTVASQVTRSADIALMTGTNFSSWYNAAEGTLYVEATKLDPSTNRFTAGIGFSSTQYIGMLFSTGSGNTFIQPSVGSFGTVVYNNTSFVKAGVGYKTGDYITSINGTNAISSSTAPVPTGAVGTLYLGTTGFSPSTITTSYFKKLSYYPLRLSNTNLQALTG